MASELVRNVWCDVHGDDDRRDVDESGLDVPFRVGKIIVVLDLCQECIDTHVKPLAELLETHGRKPGTAATSAAKPEVGVVARTVGGRLICAECGKGYAYRASLQSHMMDIHGKLMPRERASSGPVTCEHCGKTFQGAAGRASHIKTMHPEHWTGPKSTTH